MYRWMKLPDGIVDLKADDFHDEGTGLQNTRLKGKITIFKLTRFPSQYWTEIDISVWMSSQYYLCGV